MSSDDTFATFGLDWGQDEPLSVHRLAADDATLLFGGAIEAAADRYVDLVEREDVDVVVVEHGDPDHYGALPAVREAGLDVTVAAPAGDADAVEADGVAVDVRLEPGPTDWGVEAIPVPGHTPGNMAFRHGDTLVAGDTVAGSDSWFAAEGDWSGPLAPMTRDYNHDDAMARAAVADLLDHAFDDVRVTHGSNVLDGGRAAVETLVADLEAAD